MARKLSISLVVFSLLGIEKGTRKNLAPLSEWEIARLRGDTGLQRTSWRMDFEWRVSNKLTGRANDDDAGPEL